ncbi:DNA ligase D [Pelagibacterium limicola]|uniref:DNA ligase D n=1 Tax=Pelagibacterium limicola TaxID=2791022 RepID=UPI0018AFBE51|nr:DNA ligase D [Pelagibacterium limicola]
MADPSDLLKDYRQKRDFAKTREPAGRKGKKAGGRMFVVQKHDARRLHFDFRLEHDGVLKSWAVTKGPSSDPAEKRLAVRTEDHPIDYGSFEGTIPEGEYGGGTVMLWDRGEWEPEGDPDDGLKSGRLKFRLEGERMKGGWALIRMREKKGDKRENWLLIKERDDFAGGEDILQADKSVETGRKMEEIATGKPRRSTKTLPDFVKPQLATLVDSVPVGANWLFEMKYDGYRCIAAVSDGHVRLFTRSGLDWTDRFGHVVPALERLKTKSALIDGEICAFGPKGGTSFSVLKKHLSDGGPLVFFAFDLLELDGKNLRDRPLTERKKALEKLIGKRARHDSLQFSPTISGKGQEVFDAICQAGHEGIIAKDGAARYVSARTKSWLKIKCTLRQEFVVVGWSPSDKRQGGFASLLLATEEGGKLVYRGRVGTGFDEIAREDLQGRLGKRARKSPPLDGVPGQIARSARWVRPDLVVEIAYTELTDDGALRHPSFLGLREDKPAKGIGMETATTAADEIPLTSEIGVEDAHKVGIKLSSADKVLFPEQGVTKGQLAAYYAAVAPAMLDHVRDRPLSLVRCPEGRAKACFFQKHDTGGFPQGMLPVQITEKSGGKTTYRYLRDLAGLLAGVQMGVLEFHIWGSRVDNLEKPDRLVFDVDPDERLDFSDVKRAAFDIRDRLKAMGLESFPMVTGGKGIHVIVPLTRRTEWREVKAFAAGFARKMARDEPDRFTATLSKAARKGKLFIDYLRNERGSTAVAPFSTRARKGAPVAVPVSWEEVETLERANGFSLATAAVRAQGPSPWPGYAKVSQAITKALLEQL